MNQDLRGSSRLRKGCRIICAQLVTETEGV